MRRYLKRTIFQSSISSITQNTINQCSSEIDSSTKETIPTTTQPPYSPQSANYSQTPSNPPTFTWQNQNLSKTVPVRIPKLINPSFSTKFSTYKTLRCCVRCDTRTTLYNRRICIRRCSSIRRDLRWRWILSHLCRLVARKALLLRVHQLGLLRILNRCCSEVLSSWRKQRTITRFSPN